MNPRFLVAGLVIAFFAAVIFLSPNAEKMNPSSPVEHMEIVLMAEGFKPDEIWIRKGGSVTFRTDISRPFWPASNLHPSHGIYSDFDPKRPLDPGESWKFVFEKAGDWGMHDHLRSYYVGAIHVVE